VSGTSQSTTVARDLRLVEPSDGTRLLAMLRRDFGRYWESSARPGSRDATVAPLPRRRIAFESIVFKAGFQAVLLYRLSHWLCRKGWVWPAWLVARVNLTLTGADIEFSARIGPGLLIAHPAGIVIGRGSIIGSDATIFQGVTCGIRNWDDARAYPRIGDGVVLFARCSVVGGISVGNRAVIGAHALVTGNVPDGAVAKAPTATVVETTR
jgi:serine O-acetyltransferase